MKEQEYREQTGYTFHDAENQEILRKFVDREVDHNISMLVHHFISNPEAFNGSDYDYDEVLDLCRGIDYHEAALQWIETLDKDNIVEIAEDFEIEADTPEKLIKELENIGFNDDWQEFCENYGVGLESLESGEYEVLEHWIVSDRLAQKLEEKGEVVSHDFFGLTVWGRGCTGQAIFMDGVIRDIASDMEILKGQRLEWR